jgi:lysophospholipase L1-like esterase
MKKFPTALLTVSAVLLAACNATPVNDAPDDVPTKQVHAVPEPEVPGPTDQVQPIEQVSRNASPRILTMGDSLMAWHGITGGSISHSISRTLNEPVANNAVGGARILYKLPLTGAMGMKIASQYREGDWDWVVVNGGGNDLWLGCGCGPCEKKMGRLISDDGRRGEIPRLVDGLRKTGAQVVYVGYLRSPGAWSPIEHCRDEGDQLESRISKLADILPGVHFVSLADLVPHGDRSYHGIDMIHPSLKASREIGQRVAAVIQNAEQVED